MGTVITFPSERCSVGTSLEGHDGASVIILPVIRIERFDETSVGQFRAEQFVAARQAPQALECSGAQRRASRVRARAAGSRPGRRFRAAQPVAARRPDPEAVLEGAGHRLFKLSADRSRGAAARSLLRADPSERAARQLEHLHRGLPARASVPARYRALRSHRIRPHAARRRRAARRPRATTA